MTPTRKKRCGNSANTSRGASRQARAVRSGLSVLPEGAGQDSFNEQELVSRCLSKVRSDGPKRESHQEALRG
jgi:hypothetical protein